MSRTVMGACQCGAVRFRIEGEFAAFFLCHCSRCRKDTGSAHSANLFSSTALLDWISGRDSIKTYRIPRTRHQKSFCVDCGAALPTQEGALLVVPAGCLESDVDIRPSAHICYGSRATWDQLLDDIPKIDGLPPEPR
jgi:hypothetical protein